MQEVCLLCGSQGPRYLDATATPKCTNLNCEGDRGTSCYACLQLEELEEEIQKTRNYLDALIKKRPLLKQIRNTQHDPLVSKLPRELISRIFQFCLIRQDDIEITRRSYLWYTDPRITTTPFELPLVSRTWRSITISTPQLWTHVSFFLRIFGLRTERDGYFHFSRDCLSRSGSLPLSFAIVGDKNTLDPKKFGAFLDLFNSHSNRWHSLFLFMPMPLIQRLTGNGDNSRLYSLSIDPDNDHVGAFHLLGDTPQLQKVTVKGRLNHSIEINWAHIAHLTLHFCSPAEKIFDLLRSATQLESFTAIDMFGLSEMLNIPTDSPPIALPRLTELTLNRTSYTLEELFKPLQLPALTSLSFSNCDYVAPLEHHLRRWSCTLRHLSFDEHWDSPEDIVALLEGCPSLETLNITNPHDDTEQIIERFVRTHNPERPFLANLQMFHLLEENVTIAWQLIPLIFLPGPGSEESESGEHTTRNDPSPEDGALLRRDKLHMKITVKAFDYEGSKRNFFIPQEYVESLLEVRDEGFHLEVDHKHHPGQDFLLISAQHYGMRETISISRH